MRIGKVLSINETKGTCRVNYFEDNQNSIDLQISSNIYKMPAVGDLVLVANLEGAKGIVICTFFNDTKLPSQTGGVRIELSSTSYISFDKSGNLTIKSAVANIESTGILTLKGSQVVIDTNLKVNGTITDNNVNLTSHTHTDSEGGSTSTPQ